MKPNGGGSPTGGREAIDRDCGGLDKFKEQFKAAAVGQFSGWGWLVAAASSRLPRRRTRSIRWSRVRRRCLPRRLIMRITPDYSGTAGRISKPSPTIWWNLVTRRVAQ
jgi:hypothetical protein